jgi:hypothetical protein
MEDGYQLSVISTLNSGAGWRGQELAMGGGTSRNCGLRIYSSSGGQARNSKNAKFTTRSRLVTYVTCSWRVISNR